MIYTWHCALVETHRTLQHTHKWTLRHSATKTPLGRQKKSQGEMKDTTKHSSYYKYMEQRH